MRTRSIQPCQSDITTSIDKQHSLAWVAKQRVAVIGDDLRLGKRLTVIIGSSVIKIVVALALAEGFPYDVDSAAGSDGNSRESVM